jgi:hypothetical protein
LFDYRLVDIIIIDRNELVYLIMKKVVISIMYGIIMIMPGQVLKNSYLAHNPKVYGSVIAAAV